MRVQFYQCLIVVILPYFAIACDEDLCQIGTSAGYAVGCTVATGTVGLASAAGGPVGILAGLAVSAVIAGTCSAGDKAAQKGKEIIHILSLSQAVSECRRAESGHDVGRKQY